MLDDHHRTHHLLKHCLPTNNQGEAMQHFGTEDVKEAARDISRMGQRDLQGKFKLVYGSATHSNNNDWLRRKLYEAIGAAPVKAACKVKARKTASNKSRSKHAATESGSHMLTAVHTRRSKANGSPRSVQAAAAGRPWPCGMPSSPLMCGSVLELHRFHNNISQDETTSDSESQQGSDASAAKGTSAEVSSVRHAVRGAAACGNAPVAPQAAAQPPLLASKPSGPAVINFLETTMQNSEWVHAAWGEVERCAASAAAAKDEVDEDVMMLDLDLSTFDNIF